MTVTRFSSAILQATRTGAPASDRRSSPPFREQWTQADDADAQIGVRRVRAKLLAQHGSLDDAERLAREATERAGRTDYLNLHGCALCDFAEVLALAGKHIEATDVLERALGLYERKGNVVTADRTRARLAELGHQKKTILGGAGSIGET